MTGFRDPTVPEVLDFVVRIDQRCWMELELSHHDASILYPDAVAAIREDELVRWARTLEEAS